MSGTDAAGKVPLIEAGWIGLSGRWLNAATPDTLRDFARDAFFAGAQHMFTALMTVVSEGDDVTEGDLDRVAQIQEELDRFIADYAARKLPTDGSS